MSCLAIYNTVSYGAKILGYIKYTKKWMKRIQRYWGCLGCTSITDCEGGNVSLDEIHTPLDTKTNSYYFRIYSECDDNGSGSGSDCRSDKVETYRYSDDSSGSSNYTITQSLIEEFSDDSV